jgi:hypothetical protein
VAGSGSQWGPRFLLPVYPPLAAHSQPPSSIGGWTRSAEALVGVGAAAGERQFWFVDREPLSTSWLEPEVSAPPSLGKAGAGLLQAFPQVVGRIERKAFRDGDVLLSDGRRGGKC